MDKAQLAEGLLSLFTPKDRARSIVGDFEEGLSSRGRVYYWRCVATTALALCFKSVVSAPIRTIILATVGFALFSALYYVSLRLTGMGEFVATFDPSRTDWSLPAEWFPSLLAIFALVTASNFCAAAILSRFASTSEINGCAPLIALLIAYWFIYPFVARFLWGMDWQWIVAGAVIAPLTYLFPMLVGGAIARRPATV